MDFKELCILKSSIETEMSVIIWSHPGQGVTGLKSSAEVQSCSWKRGLWRGASHHTKLLLCKSHHDHGGQFVFSADEAFSLGRILNCFTCDPECVLSQATHPTPPQESVQIWVTYPGSWTRASSPTPPPPSSPLRGQPLTWTGGPADHSGFFPGPREAELSLQLCPDSGENPTRKRPAGLSHPEGKTPKR